MPKPKSTKSSHDPRSARDTQSSQDLILVLGDQLTPTLASLRAGDPATDIVLMAEVMEEATYVPHHKKKLAFIFSAMRHFRDELHQRGWTVDYVELGDRDGASFTAALERAITSYKPERIQPGVQVIETVKPGSRDQEIPATIANHPFDHAFVVALARAAELVLEQIMRLQLAERRGAHTLAATADLRHPRRYTSSPTGTSVAVAAVYDPAS